MSDRESGDEQPQGQGREAEAGGEDAGSSVHSSSGEQELATKTLQIQSKRFYLDVKQNRRGRFIKIAEVGSGGKKSRLLLAMSTAAEFRDHLTEMSEHYASLGPPCAENLPEDGKLKSETMMKDNRRYYLDLKENRRGRFLRVAETLPRGGRSQIAIPAQGMIDFRDALTKLLDHFGCEDHDGNNHNRVSQTIPRGGPRSQIAIPAQGMIEFRDALTDLLDEFGTDDHDAQGDLPESRSMRVENKMFYFDVGQNSRGVFLRVSEVRSNFRTAITIPEKAWRRFRDTFDDYVEKSKRPGGDDD